MNSRKRKKRFKKKYGVNPNQLVGVLGVADRSKTIEDFVVNFPEMMERFIQTCVEAIRVMAEEVSSTMELFYENVRTMSEEDFCQVCLGLSDDEIAYLKIIRKKGVLADDKEKKED